MKLEAAIKSLTDSVTNKDWAYGPAVKTVLDALREAEKERDDLLNQEFQQRLANAEHQLEMKDLAISNIRASRMAQFRKRKTAEAALRSAQEPVGVIKKDNDAVYGYAHFRKMLPVGTELFTRQPKPVVVLHSSTVMSRGYVVKQIEAAGIVVKDGE